MACGPLGCQHPSSELKISVTVWNVSQACYLSEEALWTLVLRCYDNARARVWVGVYCVVGLLGGRAADLYRSPGGEGQPWESALGHQEDLHGYHILPQQMAGKFLLTEKKMLCSRRFSGFLRAKGNLFTTNVCSAIARGCENKPRLWP